MDIPAVRNMAQRMPYFSGWSRGEQDIGCTWDCLWTGVKDATKTGRRMFAIALGVHAIAPKGYETEVVVICE